MTRMHEPNGVGTIELSPLSTKALASGGDGTLAFRASQGHHDAIPIAAR